MAHFVREFTDEDWFLGRTSSLHSVLRNIDEKTTKMLNESAGNASWTPSSPIIIGGAGLDLLCRLQFSGGAKTQPGPGKNYKFGNADYFQFLDVVTVTREYGCGVAIGNGSQPRDWDQVSSTDVALKSRRKGAQLLLPLRYPTGSTITSVSIVGKTPSVHTPEEPMRARLVRIGADGVLTPLQIMAANVGLDGWQPLTPTTSLSAFASLSPSVTTVVDRSLCEYALQLVDEKGANAVVGNLLATLRIVYTLANLRSS